MRRENETYYLSCCSSHGRFLGVLLLYEHITFQTASMRVRFLLRNKSFTRAIEPTSYQASLSSPRSHQFGDFGQLFEFIFGQAQ